MKRIYLDNAATTAIRPEVTEVMMDCIKNIYGNPSSLHTEGRQARALLERARKVIASSIGASIGEIFFTSGGTESNNMALKCAVRDLGVNRIITSKVEHHCVLHSVDTLKAFNNVDVDYVNVDAHGRADLNHLRSLLGSSDKKTLVSLMHANNEIGTLNDIAAIGEICKEHRALFHSDTVQTIGHYPINVNAININFLSGAAHKFHGPKGVGFIYIKNTNIIKPFIDGGAQERNMRGGTENVSSIAGMAEALKIGLENLEEETRHITDLKNYMEKKLKGIFPDIIINGCPEDSLYTVLNVSFPPHEKSEMLLMLLDISGISISGGSACSSGSEKGSHVIQEIGTPTDYKSIRFSFSHYNTLSDIDETCSALGSILSPSSNLKTA